MLIDILIGKSNVARALDPLIGDAEKGQCTLVVSEVSVAEVVTLADEEPDEVARKIDAFLRNTYFRCFPVGRSVSQRASRLRRNCSLETCDAIILATALEHGAELCYSHDGTMRKSIRKSQGAPADDVATEIDGLKVRSPLYDEALCRRAGLQVGQKYRQDLEVSREQRVDEQEGAEEARPGPGDVEGGGGGLGGGDAVRAEQAEAGKGLAEATDSEDAEDSRQP